MNAPGKGLLKTVSILFIVFGAIAAVISLLAVFGSAVLATADGGAALGGILLLATILLLIVSVLELVLGIVGLGKSGDPSKAGYFITVGIVLCVISLVSIIIGVTNNGFQVTSLIGFVLPVLYIVGGFMNKKAL
ncbi:hypothetical protein IZU99_07435 [Oscillospiraceae bacterium CM]|nr:hypothetical protein IZU99_07435 [Oscillospiraceae bacterium CM]